MKVLFILIPFLMLLSYVVGWMIGTAILTFFREEGIDD